MYLKKIEASYRVEAKSTPKHEIEDLIYKALDKLAINKALKDPKVGKVAYMTLHKMAEQFAKQFETAVRSIV